MRQTRAGLILFGIAVLLVLSACGGKAANVLPTAIVGASQTVNAGTTVTLNGAASLDADGTIASYAWTQTAGATVTLTGANTAQPTFVAPRGAAVATLSFALVVTDDRNGASTAATVTITVNSIVTVTGVVRFGRVPFSSVSPFGLNYASPVMQPARGVIVRALDATTQAVLASGSTDGTGAYSLSLAANTSIVIVTVAQIQRDSTQPLPRWDVRVQNGITGNAPYTFSSAAFNSNTLSQNIDIPTGIGSTGSATGVRASGPFAILDTVYTAMQAVIGVAPSTSFPELVVDWGSQKLGTQFSVTSGGIQYIQLLSDLTEDTEEFDQHVVAHEYGHYIENNFSRSDTIGGSHALGDKLDMRVAFSEGFGYAFATIVLNDPVVRDSFVSSGQQVSGTINVESNPVSTGCWCSETSVASILWDLYDSASDTNDNISLGFAPIWAVMTGALRTTPAVTSIFSFITALKAAQPGSVAAINTLVTAQNITSGTVDDFATTEANAPFPSMLPLFPTIIKGGGPVVVRSIDDGGHYNKAGNGHFLRFTPTATGTVTVTLTTSNPAANANPDFYVMRNGLDLVAGTDTTPQPETKNVSVTAGTTYVIEAYDCANGCFTTSGTAGDYNLTVTIN